MNRTYSRTFTTFAGGFLLLQGVSTLLFLLVPGLDRAFPTLLNVTQMVEAHSIVHIASGLLAFAILRVSDHRGTMLFAAVFGAFYAGLGLVGMFSSQLAGLGMQPFDHPFHLLVGGLGLAAASFDYRASQRGKEVFG